MKAFWIRLAPPLPLPASPPPPDHDATTAALCRLLGCSAVWWLPDSRAAWDAVWTVLDLGSLDRVIVPSGADPAIPETALTRGAAIEAAALDPHAASPVWPSSLQEVDGRHIFILDHRFGLPTPLPALRAGVVIIEDATAAVGGALGGRPVGALGQISLVRLGAAPFVRSRGALVATSDAQRTQAAAAVLDDLATRDEPAWLREDAAAVADWVEGCRAAAQVYESAWRGLAIRPASLQPAPNATATYSSYAIAVPDPDALALELARAGVETFRPAGSGLLLLPNHPGLGLGELLYVADVVRRHLLAAPSRG